MGEIQPADIVRDSHMRLVLLPDVKTQHIDRIGFQQCRANQFRGGAAIFHGSVQGAFDSAAIPLIRRRDEVPGLLVAPPFKRVLVVPEFGNPVFTGGIDDFPCQGEQQGFGYGVTQTPDQVSGLGYINQGMTEIVIVREGGLCQGLFKIGEGQAVLCTTSFKTTAHIL